MKPVLALLILAGCATQQPACLEHCYWTGQGSGLLASGAEALTLIDEALD
jgi:hypothetical protein